MLDVAYFKAKLLKRLSELDERVVDIEHELDAPAPRDWEENAVEREGDEVMESLGAAGVEEIQRIHAALRRIEDGTYGECLSCGEEIAAERLEIVPQATLCAACAQRVEAAHPPHKPAAPEA